jgi:LPS O-antigen subunit length determinant protein (WzzB/FepE family)
MGQRVNIQYSVEIEDLEAEVNRLFKAAMRNLDFKSPMGQLSLGTEGMDQVDSLRRKLAKADIMLGDVQNIIQGYVRFKTQPTDIEKQELEQSSDELELEQLQDRISQFKELMNAQPDQESEKADQ